MTTKQALVRWARRAGVLQLADEAKFKLERRKRRQSNRMVCAAEPDLRLPPDRILYETQGHLDYAWFLESGHRTARALYALFDQLFPANQPLTICEWGCGPLRVLRWMGDAAKRAMILSGCDYDAATIEWCGQAFPELDVRLNGLAPPAPFDDASLDVLYSLSVYTHLSEAMHTAWLADNLRVVKPGGCVILSVHGAQAAEHLLPDERARFDAGELVVRDRVLEGSRTFVAYQSPRYMRERLLRGLEIAAYLPTSEISAQEIWVVRKG